MPRSALACDEVDPPLPATRGFDQRSHPSSPQASEEPEAWIAGALDLPLHRIKTASGGGCAVAACAHGMRGSSTCRRDMADIPITIASGEYDRIRAMRDGVVKVEGCAVTYHVVEPNQLFTRNLKNQEFDVSEMSFSAYIALRDQGRAHYTAIPVFLSRAFRHSAIFIRTDRGIASPADLKSRRVGTPEYFTTMLVWMRGLLSDEYGIKPSDLRWRIGPLGQPAPPATLSVPADGGVALRAAVCSPSPVVGEGRVGGAGVLAAKVPAGTPPTPDPSPQGAGGTEAAVDVEAIPAGKTLAAMLADGELDAVFSARPPSCFRQSSSPLPAGEDKEAVARLFPDYRAAEQAYYRKAGVYPLMHAVGIRNSLIEQYPWMAGNLFNAFARAKDIAVADFTKLSAFALTLPWIEAEYRATQAVLGEDIWPYGVTANRRAIETLCRYLHEQGFTKRRMSADELFAPRAA
jgi:4,5-dihydroxyphthalate decarboxylase